MGHLGDEGREDFVRSRRDRRARGPADGPLSGGAAGSTADTVSKGRGRHLARLPSEHPPAPVRMQSDIAPLYRALFETHLVSMLCSLVEDVRPYFAMEPASAKLAEKMLTLLEEQGLFRKLA